VRKFGGGFHVAACSDGYLQNEGFGNKLKRPDAAVCLQISLNRSYLQHLIRC
jgi:hypothetical protein